MATSLPLAEYLRAAQIDNFAIEGGTVRIGAQRWIAEPCNCSSTDCDGWTVTPLSNEGPTSTMEPSDGCHDPITHPRHCSGPEAIRYPCG